MKSIDYSWAIGLAVLVVLILMWKPLVGLYNKMSDKATNKDAYERGKVVFYDTTRWAGEGSYKGCAMCHAADFVPDPAKTVEMPKYKAGQPYILKKLSSKYGGGAMGAGDELYEAAMQCLMAPDKMSCGRVSSSAPFMQDLMYYLAKQ
jgi:hypothetical protein